MSLDHTFAPSFYDDPLTQIGSPLGSADQRNLQSATPTMRSEHIQQILRDLPVLMPRFQLAQPGQEKDEWYVVLADDDGRDFVFLTLHLNAIDRKLTMRAAVDAPLQSENMIVHKAMLKFNHEWRENNGMGVVMDADGGIEMVSDLVMQHLNVQNMISTMENLASQALRLKAKIMNTVN